MLWIIQSGFEKEPGYCYFIEALNRLESNYHMVTYKSGSDLLEILDNESNPTGKYVQGTYDCPVFVIGGYGISRLAKKYGWIPGSYLNENFNYSAWVNGYGKENMLNSDSLISSIENTPSSFTYDSIFVRPVEDSKAFSGKVFTTNEFLEFKANIISKSISYPSLDEQTEVMISPVIKIYSETRFFVLDKKIITQSLYKRGQQVYYSREVDPFIIEYANKVIEKWQPNVAFVIDIADTENGLKIVELNNFNSSGLYDADCFKIIDTIEQFYC